jgi:hypothetical protein
MGERGTGGREPPVFIPQAYLATQEILGFGIGEEGPGNTSQKKTANLAAVTSARTCSKPLFASMPRATRTRAAAGSAL